MKKAALIFIFILQVAAVSAQEVAFTKLFTEARSQEIKNSTQGAVVYGDYLFQFRDKNAPIGVYRMSTGELLNEIPMEHTSTYHNNNTVSFCSNSPCLHRMKGKS